MCMAMLRDYILIMVTVKFLESDVYMLALHVKDC